MLFGGQFLECQLVESAAALAGFVVEVVWAFAGFSHVPSTGNQFIGPTSISQSLRQIVLEIGEGAQMKPSCIKWWVSPSVSDLALAILYPLVTTSRKALISPNASSSKWPHHIARRFSRKRRTSRTPLAPRISRVITP